MAKTMKRKIVQIDEEKCNGCGLCVPDCHEGALQIVDGKAKLVNDVYCDGLGNCLGSCPQDAISIIEKEVEAFDYEATNKHLKKVGREQLKENPLEQEAKKAKQNSHTSTKKDLPCGCPGTMVQDFRKKEQMTSGYKTTGQDKEIESELRQWPVQLHLVPPHAPYFRNADLLIAADCVPFAYGEFHNKLLKGKAVAIGCPKLDDVNAYKDKIRDIIRVNEPKSITVVTMEVPCCRGLYSAVEQALAESGKDVPLRQYIIGIHGGLR